MNRRTFLKGCIAAVSAMLIEPAKAIFGETVVSHWIVHETIHSAGCTTGSPPMTYGGSIVFGYTNFPNRKYDRTKHKIHHMHWSYASKLPVPTEKRS